MLTLILGSTTVFAQSVEKILIFVGGQEDSARVEDQVAIDSLTSWGMEIVYMGSTQFNDATVADLYEGGASADGVIISESIGSTNVPNFGIRDEYPVPIIIMEGVLTNDDASTTKWPLLDAEGGVWGFDPPEDVDVEWEINDTDHYITENYDLGQVIKYAPEKGRGVPYLHGIDPSHQVLAVATRTEGGTDNPTWVKDEAITLAVIEDPAIVYMNVAYTYLAVASVEFYDILHRSVEFISDAIPEPPEPPEGINDIENRFELKVFPYGGEMAVRFKAPAGQSARITMYDMTGKHVANLYEGETVSGYNFASFNAAEYSNGIYIVKMESGNQTLNTKVVIK